MSTAPRKMLPKGIQSFGEIRNSGCYYVDKTRFAWDAICAGKYYFLSRPRRFGKSLFLDTLAELFEGNEPLFRGLFVHDKWDWGRKHPVVRISFSGGNLKNSEDLQAILHRILTEHETKFGLTPKYPDARSRFHDLIGHCHAVCGEQVVVLVDEYDKPILDRLENHEMAQQMRESLKDLYSVFKENDAALRFVFLTGVSKFSKVSLFSGLNNLTDITLDKRYSAICGYTEDDVDTVFAPEFPANETRGTLDRERIREWYNGYNWLGEAVYNPFDLLLHFDTGNFLPFWFETGTPTFLIKLLTEREIFAPDLGRQIATSDLLSTFDVGNIPTEALLFQTGYLTIGGQEELLEETYYTMRFPNREVYQSLNNSLLKAYKGAGSKLVEERRTLGHLITARDVAGMAGLMQSFFSGIPYEWHTNNEIGKYEGYYASVFYAYFASLGLRIAVEESSRAGRLDMAVTESGAVFVFEFKVVEMEPEGKALEQILERGYADKYRAEAERLFLIGVEFSRESKKIVRFDWREEKVPLSGRLSEAS